ncbi:MAG TPA: RNA 2',3'-cyclic phosphodiesterase [Candidatus Paceibacterota bacterium]|nr:RNA 2',3'-cyclic phosphodiesterase [Candidatus Paceibacterota bacterium]
MRRRLFISLEIPAPLIKTIGKAVEKMNLPPEMRILHPEGWHITLSFLGEQDDGDITRIISAMERTAPEFECPEIVLEKFLLAPPGKKPRMIWLETDAKTSSALAKIKSVLEKNLSENGIGFESENRKFNGHITLARFSEVPASVGSINPKAGWGFTAKSLDLFESVLKRSGAEYIRLAKFDFL